jgi:predicted transcriptional regulator
MSQVITVIRATQLKEDMETIILHAVRNAVDWFMEHSGGLTPESITIEMRDVTTVGEKRKRYAVVDVQSTVSL